jgi:Recombination endonuclease VII
MPLTAEQRAAKNARRRERRAKEPEYRAKENARCRDYYQAHKQKICEGARARYQPRLCGLSATEYDALLAKQNGACAICRRRWKERLCVDHCHLTGMIRGLLCRRCNLGLGYMKDDQASLIAAVAYLGTLARDRPGFAAQRAMWVRAALPSGPKKALLTEIHGPVHFEPCRAPDRAASAGGRRPCARYRVSGRSS